MFVIITVVLRNFSTPTSRVGLLAGSLSLSLSLYRWIVRGAGASALKVVFPTDKLGALPQRLHSDFKPSQKYPSGINLEAFLIQQMFIKTTAGVSGCRLAGKK